MCKSCHKDRHRTQGWQGGTYLYGKPELLVNVRSIGNKATYDLEMDSKYENFIANGIVVHNSRNAQSSRAIPVDRAITAIRDSTWFPIFMKNKAGMAASEPLEGSDLIYAQNQWLLAKEDAITRAEYLASIGVHKQIVNRLLEPFSTIKVILSSTDFYNFFNLRIHPGAQQEIQLLAEAMRDAMSLSTPCQLDIGHWHLPYIRTEERDLPIDLLVKVSTARCARVSYLNHDGFRDIDKDLSLHDTLVKEGHMSPTEHVATPAVSDRYYGNFKGWIQYRKHIEHGWKLK